MKKLQYNVFSMTFTFLLALTVIGGIVAGIVLIKAGI